MVEEQDVLQASVDELLDTFRSAMISVIPAANRSKLNWTEFNPSDDWERLAECMFDVFVRNPIAADRCRSGDELLLPQYDFDRESYEQASWISPNSEPDQNLAFVRLLSQNQPFDTVQAVRVDPATFRAGDIVTLPWDEASFLLVRRQEGGSVTVLTGVEAV